MVLELGIGVTSCHEGGMGSHQDDAAVDGSSATGESQTAVVSVPMRLFAQSPHPWREVRQPIPKIPLNFDSLGGIVSSDLGVLGRGVQSSAIVSKS